MKKRISYHLILLVCIQSMLCTPVLADFCQEEGELAEISLGSYPGSEVAGEDLTTEILDAPYNEDGYCTVGGTRYKKLGIMGEKDQQVYGRYYESWHIDEESGLFVPPDTIYSSSAGRSISYEEYKRQNSAVTGYRYFRCEPVIWDVLYEEDGKLLVMADQILDCRIFDDGRNINSSLIEDGSVGETAIQEWLNQSFLKQAFSDEERKLIMPGEQVKWEKAEVGEANWEGFVSLPDDILARNLIIPSLDNKGGEILTTDYAAALGAEDNILMLRDGYAFLENGETPVTMLPDVTGLVLAYERGVCPVMIVDVKNHFEKGDANYDGGITLEDAQLTLKASLGIMNKTYGMDWDQDDQVNLKDTQRILELALGI